jgi:hypothetical protein
MATLVKNQKSPQSDLLTLEHPSFCIAGPEIESLANWFEFLSLGGAAIGYVYNITKWHSQFKFSTLIGSVQNLALASI